MIFSQLKALKSLGFLRIIYLIIAIAAGFFGTVFIFSVLGDRMFADDMVCYVSGGFAGIAFIAFTVEIALLVYGLFILIGNGIKSLVSRKETGEHGKPERSFYETELENESEKKASPAQKICTGAIMLVLFAALNAILVYALFTDMTVVNKSGIICKSVTNPSGESYGFDDVESYTVEDDGSNNAVLELKMSDGKTIEIGSAENAAVEGYGDGYEDLYSDLIWIDETLRSRGTDKYVFCTPDDFDYYDSEKKQLDILMSTE